ncbi:MAG: hypothetical protein ABSG07_18850 [Terriglobales bacterium]
MKELGEAINESLSDSESIAEVVAHTSEKTSLVSTLRDSTEFKISDQDLKFLKSLRIKIEEEENE